MSQSQSPAPGSETSENSNLQTSFFTNHAHVLACIARDSQTTLRSVAMALQLTERAVQRIVADLEKDGILTKQKVGRCNDYRISKDRLLGHPLEKNHTIAEFLEFTDS